LAIFLPFAVIADLSSNAGVVEAVFVTPTASVADAFYKYQHGKSTEHSHLPERLETRTHLNAFFDHYTAEFTRMIQQLLAHKYYVTRQPAPKHNLTATLQTGAA
jgi:hypothetical protein